MLYKYFYAGMHNKTPLVLGFVYTFGILALAFISFGFARHFGSLLNLFIFSCNAMPLDDSFDHITNESQLNIFGDICNGVDNFLGYFEKKIWGQFLTPIERLFIITGIGLLIYIVDGKNKDGIITSDNSIDININDIDHNRFFIKNGDEIADQFNNYLQRVLDNSPTLTEYGALDIMTFVLKIYVEHDLCSLSFKRDIDQFFYFGKIRDPLLKIRNFNNGYEYLLCIS